MPVTTTYPGVYVEELPSGVHTIKGVATSIAAFIGWAPQGPIDRAQLVLSWSDYYAQFGGLDTRSYLGYGVSHFFANGGQQAYIVRLTSNATAAAVTWGNGNNTITATARNPGNWANSYWIGIKNQAIAYTGTTTNGSTTISNMSGTAGIPVGSVITASSVPTGTTVNTVTANSVTMSAAATGTATGPISFTLNNGRFRLQVIYAPSGATSFPVVESFENLSITNPDPQGRFVGDVIRDGSSLITAAVGQNATTPPIDTPAPVSPPPNVSPMLTGGNDGTVLQPATSLTTPGAFETALTGTPSAGVYLLDHVDLFNLLCVPGEITTATLSTLEQYCEKRRAVLIADAENITDFGKFSTELTNLQNIPGSISGTNAALYFPWIQAPDPQKQNTLNYFPPCGYVAGVMARTDANRGVWKAPAGIETTLTGVSGVALRLNDNQNGLLNPFAVNCIRTFDVYGTVVWGARTVQGNDDIGSQWKYVPIRRLALYLEESLFRALKWVVFEPNDEPLWAQIRLNVGAFMQTLFRQGAFQGSTPKQAYFVKCDSETTTPTDQNNGVVNILVGFAPLKPAEFVVIQIQQMAGQSAA
jgi:phage tail sheath protein FI